MIGCQVTFNIRMIQLYKISPLNVILIPREFLVIRAAKQKFKGRLAIVSDECLITQGVLGYISHAYCLVRRVVLCGFDLLIIPCRMSSWEIHESIKLDVLQKNLVLELDFLSFASEFKFREDLEYHTLTKLTWEFELVGWLVYRGADDFSVKELLGLVVHELDLLSVAHIATLVDIQQVFIYCFLWFLPWDQFNELFFICL